MRIIALLLVLVMAAAPSTGLAAATGSVTGRVLDPEGKPMPSATVLIKDTQLGAMTDHDGRYSIKKVPAGSHTIIALKIGFGNATGTVLVVPKQDNEVNVRFEPGTRTQLEARSKTVKPPLFPLTLIESFPVETGLNDPDIPEAADAWLYLIRSAKSSLDFAHFYASDDPTGGGRLKPVIEAIEEAADRGVNVRFLAEQVFYKTYPEILDRFAARKNITVRRLNSRAFDGGVLHAKYFIKDGTVSILGSQNFDWRALDHIQELGVIVDDPFFTAQLMDVFELDWEIAGTVPVDAAPGVYDALVDSIVSTRRRSTDIPESTGYERYEFAASPTGRIPDERTWDEPKIVDIIDGARDSLQIQLLTYRPVGRDSTYYDVLENALRRAATRGVKVRLLLADWCKRKPTIDYVKSLSLWPGIEIRMMVIPEWSGGFLPFARVVHAKYMIADGERFWLGTSNWERDYFHTSRNVGIVGASRYFGKRLDDFFRTGWTSPYAEVVRPEVEYAAPRISE